MKMLLQYLVVLLLCSGCAHDMYGNMTDLSDRQLATIADKTVAYMTEYWLPAKTKLAVPVSEKPNVFHGYFVERLRKVGYGVYEYKQNYVDEVGSKVGNGLNGYIELRYLIDQERYDEGNEYYRVLVFVGGDSIGGAFKPGKGGTVAVVGSWSHKIQHVVDHGQL